MTELRIAALPENLDAVNAFVEEQLDACACPMKASMQLMVALEELYVNIAHYAYGDATGDALIQVEMCDGMFIIRLIDEGMPFDPIAKDDPDITLPAEERDIGGLGIFMVKKSMDMFTYARQEGRNIVTIGKRIA